MAEMSATLTDIYGSIREDLAEVERVFDDEIASQVPCVRELCAHIHGFRGKMLRPALLLLCARACGRVTGEHHVLGAVVEMVHMATLVHDDVLDEADERRRRPTVNAVYGNVSAVLLGDYLISHAFHLCSSLDSQRASRIIGATTNRVCEGELLQNFHRGNAALDEAQYYDLIGRKTADLTAASCELGAMYAGAAPAVVRAMREYGYAAGVAFQIVDDVLDVVGDASKVGKTLHIDLDLGKATLPTIHCLANASEDVRRTLSGAIATGPAALNGQLRGLLETTDSLNYALAAARRQVDHALAQLEAVPPGEARSALTTLASFIVERQL
jgi:octaprenyl-diphosphate synthase